MPLPTLFPETWGKLGPVVPRTRAHRKTRQLNDAFIRALGDRCDPDYATASSKPFDVHAYAPLPSLLRVYLYRLTTHAGERQAGAHRIQITLPRGSNQHFDTTDDAFPILAGYDEQLKLFVLWDAAAHDTPAGMPYSKGVQVHEDTLLDALASGISKQTRTLRGASQTTETVVAAHEDLLYDALDLRWQLHVERLMSV